MNECFFSAAPPLLLDPLPLPLPGLVRGEPSLALLDNLFASDAEEPCSNPVLAMAAVASEPKLWAVSTLLNATRNWHWSAIGQITSELIILKPYLADDDGDEPVLVDN
jgi:hypothetical protein